MRVRNGVGADGQVYEVVTAIRIRLLGAREFCLVLNDRDHGVRQDASCFVGDGARDATECLLSLSVGWEDKRCTQG